MESLPALLGLAIVLFVSTNVDDLVVLVAFFAHSKFRAGEVVAGQYLGLAVLFVVSAVGALLALVIPNAYLGLLGIFPILIGIRKLIALRHETAEADLPGIGRSRSIAGVALVTIANGGDNVGVYMPSFAVHSFGQAGKSWMRLPSHCISINCSVIMPEPPLSRSGIQSCPALQNQGKRWSP